MNKVLKKKKKTATIDEIESMALKGKDTSKYFLKPKRMPPREVRKVAVRENILKVNVDVTESFLHELDAIAMFLNISRQAVMKTFLKEGVDRHFLAKHARKASGE
jgi:predicted secreted acid phosphatase